MLIEGRQDEQSKYQARDIESKDNPAVMNKVATKKTSKCRACGDSYPHQNECPGKGKQCHPCGKSNHFAKVCQTSQKKGNPKKGSKPSSGQKKPIQPLEMQESSDSESDDEYVYAVNSGHSCPKVNIKVGGCQFKTTIDTGASVNVMDQSTFTKLNNVQLSKAKIKAFLYDSREPVEFIGKFDATVETKQRITVATFYVTKTASSGNLLSSDTLQELNLISLHLNKLAVTNNVKDANLQEILDQHAEVFEGLGKLKGQTVHLNIDKEVTPRAQPQGRILYHIR